MRNHGFLLPRGLTQPPTAPQSRNPVSRTVPSVLVERPQPNTHHMGSRGSAGVVVNHHHLQADPSPLKLYNSGTGKPTPERRQKSWLNLDFCPHRLNILVVEMLEMISQQKTHSQTPQTVFKKLKTQIPKSRLEWRLFF